MSAWLVALVMIGGALLLYAVFVLVLVVAGRRETARAVGGFISDAAVFFGRLLRDRRVPRRHKFLMVLLVAYLSVPFDLVPDFIPVAGQLDDAILVAFVLRTVLRNTGRELISEHWPGPAASRALMLRLAGVRSA